MAISYLIPGWKAYQNNTRALAEKMLDENQPFDLVVAISRGGLTLGHLLTDYLDIPISVISIQSYTDIQKQGKVEMTEGLNVVVVDKRILLVDDVSDSGKTFHRAFRHVTESKASEVVTAAMYVKPHTVFWPDYFVQETDKWIIFPYENTEMIKLMMANMVRERKTEKEIEKAILSLGYSLEDLAFVKKYYPSKY